MKSLSGFPYAPPWPAAFDDWSLAEYQKKGNFMPLVRLVLTHGVDTYTYYGASGTSSAHRILDIEYRDSPYSQKAVFQLENQDKVLTSLDFKGFQAIHSYGIRTPAGYLYKDQDTLWVEGQYLFNDVKAGMLYCVLTAKGIPDNMADEKAMSTLQPASTDTTTVKAYIISIAGALLAPFTHCEVYTLAWDADETSDPLLLYPPTETLRIYEGQSRLSILRRLMIYTDCVMRFRQGLIRIMKPVVL